MTYKDQHDLASVQKSIKHDQRKHWPFAPGSWEVTAMPLECSTQQECLCLTGSLGPCLMVYDKYVVYSGDLGPLGISSSSTRAEHQGQPRRWSVCLFGQSPVKSLDVKSWISCPSWVYSVRIVTHCCWGLGGVLSIQLHWEKTTRSSACFSWTPL